MILGAISCSLAGVYYGIPEQIESKIEEKLDENFKSVLSIFDSYYLKIKGE